MQFLLFNNLLAISTKVGLSEVNLQIAAKVEKCNFFHYYIVFRKIDKRT